MLLSKNYVSEFGREGETCTLRGHTAPLQTATATTYGPTSLYNFWSRRWVLPPYGHGPEPCALLCLPLLDKIFGVIFGSCTRTFCFIGKNALYYTNITIKSAGVLPLDEPIKNLFQLADIKRFKCFFISA